MVWCGLVWNGIVVLYHVVVVVVAVLAAGVQVVHDPENAGEDEQGEQEDEDVSPAREE